MSNHARRFYITTPIYYVNDVPHIGHAYTTIAADASARYRRLLGDDVVFLTGTDEHGQKVQQAAEKSGVDPKTHVDNLHRRFKDLWKRFNISNTDFIRTTEERHTQVVREILAHLQAKGEIYKDTYEGWYCLPDERFWTEKDLVNGNCPECGRAVDKIRESNYFFKMGRHGEWLAEYIRANENYIQPASRRNEVLGFLGKPLGDLCISRPRERLPWGIPLPFDEAYVTYVWFDALINYVSIHGGLDRIRQCGHWPCDHHLVGKDILTTHAVYWSTMLRALDLPLPRNIFAHGWWTVNGQKMSKSLRNTVEPNLLLDRFGADAVRYFLLREVPFGLDGDFSHKALIGRINSDLANNLGNLVNRTLNMAQKYHGGIVPEPAPPEADDAFLTGKAAEAAAEVSSLHEQLAFSKILVKIWELVDTANQYITRTGPWELAKTETGKIRLSRVMYNALESLRVIAVLIAPFMPEAAAKIVSQLGMAEPLEKQGMASLARWGGLKPGTRNAPGAQLFPRIEDDAAARILAEADGAAPAPQPPASGAAIAPAQPETAPISIDEFAKVDLRTGKIVAAENVPKSKKLVKLRVDIGTEVRQVVAGIAEAYTPDQLVGRTIILVANLKPAKLMGIESQGMVLAGSADGKIVLAGFDQELKPGIRVK